MCKWFFYLKTNNFIRILSFCWWFWVDALKCRVLSQYVVVSNLFVFKDSFLELVFSICSVFFLKDFYYSRVWSLPVQTSHIFLISIFLIFKIFLFFTVFLKALSVVFICSCIPSILIFIFEINFYFNSFLSSVTSFLTFSHFDLCCFFMSYII